MTVSIEAQLEAARREVKMRKRVYGRRVEQGSMSQALATRETEAMEAIVVTLEGLAAKDRLL